MRTIFASLVVLICSAASASRVPTVKLSYANIFDSICVKQTGAKIDSEWVNELTNRLPQLQANWNKSGTTLLKSTTEIVGKEFDESELGASFSLCSFPSMHDPLLINMRYSLSSFVQPALSTDVTISILFHEILHRYLEDKIPPGSPLLLKYKNEDETVLTHLHLFAIQKAVYLKLGSGDTLAAVIKKDGSLPNASYARAWNIVNSVEDYQSFLLELR